MEMMLKVMICVVDIEVDKPRNLVAKFPTNMSATTWWSYLELIQIAPPGGQI